MKRKMIGAAAAYMAGLFFASFFTGTRLAVIFIAALGAAGAYFALRGFKKADAVLAAAFLVFGTAVGLGRNYRADAIERELSGETVSFTGTVVDMKRYDGEKVGYVLKGKAGGRTIKVRLYEDDLGAEYGDGISVGEAALAPPESDYLYDGENAYRAAGVSFYLSGARDISLERRGAKKLKNRLASYRARVSSDFRTELGDEEGGFLSGMIFGESQALDEETSRDLYRCGIGHVLAMSGLHISIIFAAATALCRSVRLGRKTSLVIADAASLVMIIAANSPVSAVRAAIMANFFYAAGIFRRRSDPLNSLAAAVLLIGVADPDCVYSRGFILSAAGTFGVGVFGPYLTKGFKADTLPKKLAREFVIFIAASVVIAPFCMRYFGETSLISPVTNILLAPLCGFALLIGTLYFFTGGFVDLTPLAGAALKIVTSISEKLSGSAKVWFACGSEDAVSLAFALMAGVAAVCALARSRRLTAAATALSCALVFFASAARGAREYDTFTVAVLGKNSNAAVVVTYRGETEVFDLSGDYRSPEYAEKYFKENGISSAEAVVLTKRTQSQYASYSVKIPAESWAVCGEAPVYGGENVSLLGENGFVFEREGWRAEYSGGTLTIERGGTTIVFAPTSAKNVPRGDTIFVYGSGEARAEKLSGEEIIRLGNGENNFKETISASGGTRIRRLRCRI